MGQRLLPPVAYASPPWPSCFPDSDEERFFSAYFHDDWCLDASTEWDVIAQYFREQQSVESLIHVAKALHGLLAGDEDDETLSRRLFREFGSYFDPRGAGGSTRTWLARVAREFDEENARRGQ